MRGRPSKKSCPARIWVPTPCSLLFPSLFCLTVTILLAFGTLGCSETSKPATHDELPPEGPFNGWIPSDVGLGSIRAELLIHTLSGSTSVHPDGGFEAVFEDSHRLQPLVASMRDGTPILIALVRPGDGPIRLDTKATALTLLMLDPIFRDVPETAREEALRGMGEEIGIAAAGIRERLVRGRFEYLIDRADLAIQSFLAEKLRESVDGTGLPIGDAEPESELPWLAAGEGTEEVPVVVNPQTIHYAVGVEDYYGGNPRGPFLIERALMEDVARVGPPVRTLLPVPGGRYRIVLSSGGETSSANDASPQAIATRENILEAASHYLRDAMLSEPGSFLGSDSLRSLLVGLTGLNEVYNAMSSGDGVGFEAAVGVLIVGNLDRILRTRDTGLHVRFHNVASVYAEATRGMEPGQFIGRLMEPPETVESYIRIAGQDVRSIDSPETVRQPTDLVAAYSSGFVHLRWTDHSDNEDGYILERRGDGFYEEIASLTAEADRYYDSNVQIGRDYSYRVVAYTHLTQSAPSNEAVVTIDEIEDETPPADITDLKLVERQYDAISLTWTAPGDDGNFGVVSEYDIRFSEIGITDETWAEATPAHGRAWPDPGGTTERFLLRRLSPDTQYFIAVRSRDEAGNRSGLSNVVSGRTTSDNPDDAWLEGFGLYPDGNGLNGDVWSLIVFRDDLVAGGNFTYAGGVAANYIARWDGDSWHPLGQGMDGFVRSLVLYKGDLVAGGLFTFAEGEQANGIARWNGTSWISLGTGTDGVVKALTVYNGDLVAGGAFAQVDGVRAASIARWDGHSWHPLDSGVNNQVFSFETYDGKLVVGGDFGLAGGVPGTSQIASWDGESWGPLGVGFDLDYVQGMSIYNGDLIAGGQFIHAGDIVVNNIARWDGAQWHAFGSGADNWVRTLYIHDEDLIVGGQFWTLDGVAARYLGRWNGSSWRSFGSGTDGLVRTIVEWKGNLVVGGRFTRAGDKASYGIAFWQE